MSRPRPQAALARWPASGLAAAVAAVATALYPSVVAAHGPHPSDASMLSAMPNALSMTVPAVVLSGGAMLTVVAIEASAAATIWTLERASDGARFSVTLASAAAGGSLLAVGTAVTASAIGTGWILSAAGRVLAFVPNEIGRALLHNEKITR